MLGLGLGEGNAEAALPDFRPGCVPGPAADRSDGARRRRSEFGEPGVSERLDGRDSFQDRLEEDRFVLRPRLEPGGKRGIVDWKAFAGPQQRVVVQSGWRLGPEASGERREALAGEEMFDHLAAGVRGAA